MAQDNRFTYRVGQPVTLESVRTQNSEYGVDLKHLRYVNVVHVNTGYFKAVNQTVSLDADAVAELITALTMMHKLMTGGLTYDEIASYTER